MISPYVLASIVERVGGFASRKRFQRYFYFLESLSGATGFKFHLNRFGPYSNGLSACLYAAQKLNYMEEEVQDDIGFRPVAPTPLFAGHRKLEENDNSEITILDHYAEQLKPVLTASHELLDHSATLQHFFVAAQKFGSSAYHDPIASAQRHSPDLWYAEKLYQAIGFLYEILRTDNLYLRPTTDPEPNL